MYFTNTLHFSGLSAVKKFLTRTLWVTRDSVSHKELKKSLIISNTSGVIKVVLRSFRNVRRQRKSWKSVTPTIELLTYLVAIARLNTCGRRETHTEISCWKPWKGTVFNNQAQRGTILLKRNLKEMGSVTWRVLMWLGIDMWRADMNSIQNNLSNLLRRYIKHERRQLKKNEEQNTDYHFGSITWSW